MRMRFTHSIFNMITWTCSRALILAEGTEYCIMIIWPAPAIEPPSLARLELETLRVTEAGTSFQLAAISTIAPPFIRPNPKLD